MQEDCEVWYECRHALSLFLNCSTQWRHSMSGMTGLDYSAVLSLFDIYDIKQKKRIAMLDDIRALESGALQAFNEKANK